MMPSVTTEKSYAVYLKHLWALKVLLDAFKKAARITDRVDLNI